MFRSAFLAVVVIVSIVAQECNVGDLLGLLVTYQVSLHNASNRTAFVTVATQSSVRDATAPAGSTIVARSFKAGKWAAAIRDVDPDLNAAMVKLRDNVTKLWVNRQNMTPAQVSAIYAENKGLHDLITSREAAVGTSAEASCGSSMTATDPPTDQEVVLTATFANGKWNLAC